MLITRTQQTRSERAEEPTREHAGAAHLLMSSPLEHLLLLRIAAGETRAITLDADHGSVTFTRSAM